MAEMEEHWWNMVEKLLKMMGQCWKHGANMVENL